MTKRGMEFTAKTKKQDVNTKLTKHPAFRIRHSLRGHESMILRIALSPDGSIIASSSKDGKVLLWDAASGRLLHTFNHNLSVNCLSWSPNGNVLASATDRIHLWDLNTGEKIGSLIDNRPSHISDISWSPNGDILASSSSNVLLWDIKSGKILHNLNLVPPNCGFLFNCFIPKIRLAWSPNGDVLALGTMEYVILYDPKTGEKIGSLNNYLQLLTPIIVMNLTIRT